MADKRMFAKSITESDAFTDMPSTAQALYFHLNQNADDDGFNNQVNHAIINAHASPDDLKLLLVKKFLIRFESGVIVIKHWRIHNTIQKDRYNPTNFQEELAMLGVKDNKAYTLNEDVELLEITDDLEDSKKNEMTPARQKRAEAYKESDLPYSFTYKIKRAFIGEKCPICGVTMGISQREPDDPIVYDGRATQPTIQHNLPISMGGKHDIDNISVVCGRCNASLQANPTGKLNNDLVKQKWSEICNSIVIGSGLETEVRLEKDSLGKVSIVPKGTLVQTEPEEIDIRPVNQPKKILSSEQTKRFEAFWKAYPKKQSKATAEKAWQKILPDDFEMNVILQAIEQAKQKDSRFRDMQFIPLPATWLNARSWENEYEDQEPQPQAMARPQRSEGMGSFDADQFFNAAINRRRKG